MVARRLAAAVPAPDWRTAWEIACIYAWAHGMPRWAERDREDLTIAAGCERRGDHKGAAEILASVARRRADRPTRIPYPVTGRDDAVRARAPWRAPHHTVSVAGLLGGGGPVRPGEVALAHGGMLFLDNLAEFARSAIDGLRWALDDRAVEIIRARYHVTMPARFTLIAGLDPCPCGFSCHAPRAHETPRGCVCRDSSIGLWWERARPILARPDVVTLVYGCDLAALPTDLWSRAVVVREPAAFAACDGGAA